MLDVDINDDLRNQVARLEAEVASVSSKVEEAQSYHKNKVGPGQFGPRSSGWTTTSMIGAFLQSD